MTEIMRLGDLLEEKNRLIEILDDVEYACGGVRLHGRGVFVREYKRGVDIKKKFVQHEVKDGDIVYSTLFAKSGAFAVADSAVSGCVLSEKFPTFAIKDKLVTRDYLAWLFRSGQLNRIAEEQMTGIAAFSLSHLSKKKFLDLRIPVPSHARQAEVVKMCVSSAQEVARAIDPLKSNLTLVDGLLGAAATKTFVDYPRIKISEIGDYVLRHVDIKAGHQYKQITVAMKHRGLRLRRVCDGSDIKSPGQSSVLEGDILFSRIDIRQGAIGFVDKDLEGGVVTRDFPVFRLHNTVDADLSFLKYVFMTPEFMTQAQEASRGTTGRKKMKRPAFLNFEIPWPSEKRRADATKRLGEFEKQVAILRTSYKRNEVLVKAFGHSIIASLFARDAGLL